MNEQNIENFLVAFGLKNDFDREELKESYRKLVEKWHPDKYKNDPNLKQKSENNIKKINDDYLILENYLDQRKSQYTKTTTQLITTNSNDSSGVLAFVALIIVISVIIIVGSQIERDISTDITSKPIKPIPNELDKKYGFKSLRFGMTYKQLRRLVKPVKVEEEKRIEQKIFVIENTKFNKIGDYKVDKITCRLFQNKLYRIGLKFSENHDEIFEAFKIKYGTPYENDTWTRGDEKLTAMTWEGDSVSAAILSPINGKWDAVVMIENNLRQEAVQYEQDEPKRAAEDFTIDGFKILKLGSTYKSLYKYINPKTIHSVNKYLQKKVSFKGTQLLKIGFYPLDLISGEFFRNRLYRIDLEFSENNDEIFEAFKIKYGTPYENDTWTRGEEKLKGMTWAGDSVYATILSPINGTWDSIVMIEKKEYQKLQDYIKDIPKKAAEDL